ncbi:MAG TPA: Wzz/FepE/Etk N-terminal domain-containing protein, partial [Verrucomicrobiae bacterium]|nr:Wzz/FepE/Etk N-terminal domain-containing protein [Verrucomicrobiae bacterium]
MQTSAQQLHVDQEVHLQDYLNVILRRRRTFLITFLTIFLGVALYTFLATPVYEASAKLHVRDAKGKNGVLADLAVLDPANPVDAELEILKSRTNMEEVVRRLNLDLQVLVEKGHPSLRILDFSSGGDTRDYLVEFTGANTFKVINSENRQIGTGRRGQLFQRNGIRLMIG